MHSSMPNRGSGLRSTIGPYQILAGQASIVRPDGVDGDMFAA
jgi:hypothetical protein